MEFQRTLFLVVYVLFVRHLFLKRLNFDTEPEKYGLRVDALDVDEAGNDMLKVVTSLDMDAFVTFVLIL